MSCLIPPVVSSVFLDRCCHIASTSTELNILLYAIALHLVVIFGLYFDVWCVLFLFRLGFDVDLRFNLEVRVLRRGV